MSMVFLTVLAVCSLLGYACLFTRFSTKPLYLTFFIACGAIISILFWAALSGLLPQAGFFVFVAGLIAGGVSLYRDTGRFKTNFNLTAFIVLTVGVTVLYLETRGLLLVSWDEFSHWAAISKTLLLTNALPNKPGSLLFLDYPPGEALFHYFLIRPVGFSEENILFAHGLFAVAALLTLGAALTWREPLILASMITIAVLAGSFFGIFGTSWTTVTIDHNLAFAFVATVMIYHHGGRSVQSILWAAPAAAALVLLKESGALFVAVAAGIIVCDQTIKLIQCKADWRTTVKTAFAVVAFVVPSILNASLWKAHLKAIGAPKTFDSSLSMLMSNFQDASFSSLVIEVSQKFGAALVGDMPISTNRMGLPAWLSIIAAIAFARLITTKDLKEAFRFVVSQAVLAVAFIGYVLILFYYYLVSFPVYEAKALASFDRYVGTFILAWAIVNVGLITQKADTLAKLWVVRIGVAGLAGATITAAWPIIISTFKYGARGEEPWQDVLAIRKEVRTQLRDAERKVPLDARVYIVWNNTTGLPFYVSQFELRPRVTNGPHWIELPPRSRRHRTDLWCHSLGPARFPNDVWSCDWPVEFLKGRLKNFDYLFLGHGDDAFWSTYSDLFSADARSSGATVFRIDRENGGTILRPFL
jgi:hypothetical protein